MKIPPDDELAFITEHCAKRLYYSLFSDMGAFHAADEDIQVSVRRMVVEVFTALWDLSPEEITRFFNERRE
jgi:hypothetical protein